MASTKGSYPNGQPRLAGDDLFSNIMLTPEYNQIPIIFDF